MMKWKHRVIHDYVHPCSDEMEAIEKLQAIITEQQELGWKLATFHRYDDGVTAIFTRPNVEFFTEATEAVMEALESFKQRSDARFVAENIVSIIACITDKGEPDEPDSED